LRYALRQAQDIRAHRVLESEMKAVRFIALTGDQLIRLAARVQPGQTLLVSGALGSARQLPEAEELGGATAAKLFGRVKDGGHFDYVSALPEGTATGCH
jgi:hypothetical protein